MRVGKTIPRVNITFPIEVIQTNKIPPIAKLIFGVLYSSCDPIEKGICKQWTPKTLTKFFNTTEQNIYKIIKQLEEEKLVFWMKEKAEINFKRSFKKYFKIKQSFKKMQKAVYSNNINYEVINDITNNNSINNTKYYLLDHVCKKVNTKKIKEQFKSKHIPKKKPPINPLLEKLFNLPNIPKHRQSTQIYLKASNYFNLLLKGGLFKKSELDKKWLTQFDIPERLINQRWQEAQIIKVFANIAKAYTNGYEPLDKKILPKVFVDILYNPRSHKSLFLKVAAAGRVRAMADKQTDNEVEQLSPIEKEMTQSLLTTVTRCYTKNKAKDIIEAKTLVTIAKGLMHRYDVHLHKKSSLSSAKHFIKDYNCWVLDEYENRLDSIKQIQVNSTCWFRYVKSRGFNE